ncbi:hypothetical protein IMZ48_09550 [Candidatus Bathyarchaeota archaeon]|nr:hypothetical protein [Candidatus Bathyarchaeota archaeon]
MIFNQKNIQKTMASFNYDAEKLPLGKLGRTTISRGFQALKDLGAVLQDNAVAKRDYDMTPLEAIEFFSNKVSRSDALR